MRLDGQDCNHRQTARINCRRSTMLLGMARVTASKACRNWRSTPGLVGTIVFAVGWVAGQGIASGQPRMATPEVPVRDSAGDRQGSAAVAANEAAPAEPLDPGQLPAHVFAAHSFWYQPIPKDIPLHPESENLAREFVRQVKAYYGHAAINTSRFSAPIYVVGPDTQPSVVMPWDCKKRGKLDKRLAAQWRTVPIPPNAEPSHDSDGEMTVYQPATDTLWEFFKARRKTGGRWEACWGGRMRNVSGNAGIWPHPYGATATGLPIIGGTITVDELRRGRIDHVMGISLVQVEDWRVFSWPANRSDGYNPSRLPNRVPEGLRFRLDPQLDVDALQLHPVARIIAKAAQTYGFVVWDKGGAIALRAEDPKRFTTVGQPDPYPELWKGVPPSKILTNFPWDRLQFLPVDYGRP